MRLSGTRRSYEGGPGALGEAEAEWIVRLEGPMQGSLDAFHWLRVYDELTRTLEEVVHQGGGADAQARLAQARARREHWARQASDAEPADSGGQ